MKSIFSGLTRLSLRFRVVTLALMALISVAGVVAVTQLKQELIPPVSFPQTIILSQASGMTSEQVLTVLTNRIEVALATIPEVVNVESQTTGAFGAVITARNDFGQNQARLRGQIGDTLDQVWLPLRRIQPPEGETPAAFAARLLTDMTPEVLIYLEERDSNFLFQLAPQTWSALSDETVTTVLAYLAAQTSASGGQETALRRLVDQEIVPSLESLALVASVQVAGGQILPDENSAAPTSAPIPATDAPSLLLQLSAPVWNIVSEKAGVSGDLDAAAVETLRAQVVEIPLTPPTLPESWQMDRFKDAGDLIEMRTLTRNLGVVFNTFQTNGDIVGSLGQTDDLTPDVVAQMIAIEPTLVEYFKAEHLAAMSDEVFASLPDDFIAGLDGFTRDELTARALAQSITGVAAAPSPVDLPSPWKLSPPQLITFSFDDLPLANFSISGEGIAVLVTTDAPPIDGASDAAVTSGTDDAVVVVPEGPALPFTFNLIGVFLGTELNTADDLIDIQLSDELAAQFGGTANLSAAQFFNFFILLANPDALPEGVEVPSLPIDVNDLIASLSPEVVAFVAENDPTFIPTLSADVFNALSDDVLSQPQIAPPLDQVWNTLDNQPQFSETPLRNGQDVLTLGDGQASTILDTINETVPEQFAGYEVRLFDSLSPALVRYFALNEPDFYVNLDVGVLEKLSPVVLSALPEDVLTALDAPLRERLTAIAAGDTSSAADDLAALYASDVPPADPNAPVLNDDWQFVGDFVGVELDSADDFFRFFPNPPNFLNSFFDSAQGASFAPNLYGGLSSDALNYMIGRQPDLLNLLRVDALRLLSPDVLAALPAEVQARVESGGEPFVPIDTVTRTNGSASLQVVVFKARDANTVEAYHAVEDVLNEIDAANDSISVEVGFQQSEFIEESISGVTREGLLGAIFAVVVILVFLSSGSTWGRRGRVTVGIGMVVLFLILLVLLVGGQAPNYGGDFALAFENTDIVWRFLLIAGAVIGLVVALYPGKLPYPAWRSTLVTAVSIPLSVLMALALMRWLPPAVNAALAPSAEGSDLLTFILRIFPPSITINIMTLSGLTVAIGRVVDDSIVVLENIFRQVQAGGDRKQAIIEGTRDVSVAIFAATVITVVVFLPLGLTGGIIGEFFLPFGLAVTYSLLASFVVAITVVPVMAYLLLDAREMAHEETQSWIERLYVPVLKWALDHKLIILVIAFASLIIGGALFGTRPQAFLPAFGEPQIGINVALPAGTPIAETNALVEQLETYIETSLPEEGTGNVQVIIGGGTGLQDLILGGGQIAQNEAQITIAVEDSDQLDPLTAQVRTEAERIFGEGNVTVSAASLSEQGFGGFALVLSGASEDITAINDQVVETLNGVDGLANVTSNLSGLGAGAQTYIRIDGETAVRYTGELETENTLGVTADAKAAVLALPNLPATIKISEGFETELQTQGFANLFVAMGIAIGIVILLLILTFGSLVHWLDIMLSIVVAPVGAAVLLTVTNRVLGISALIGLLMLIGIVVTNAVVLIDRVQSNRRERGMELREALEEAGDRRLRPILMTALATIFALSPLAIGLSEGAIIASELGTVVIGGLFSSTILTLLVVPVAYMLLAPLHGRIARLFGAKPEPTRTKAGEAGMD
ncbi:MAG: efflux RND transporter permease subunit [Chloroflexota bacterium]|nr:efflux RND transporter permease subunit [Chloroflexota bacterium]